MKRATSVPVSSSMYPSIDDLSCGRITFSHARSVQPHVSVVCVQISPFKRKWLARTTRYGSLDPEVASLSVHIAEEILIFLYRNWAQSDPPRDGVDPITPSKPKNGIYRMMKCNSMQISVESRTSWCILCLFTRHALSLLWLINDLIISNINIDAEADYIPQWSYFNWHGKRKRSVPKLSIVSKLRITIDQQNGKWWSAVTSIGVWIDHYLNLSS